MRLDEMIGLLWEVQVDEADIADTTDCDLIQVIEIGDSIVENFVPGLVRVWLNTDTTVWKIDVNYPDGGSLTVSR